MLGVIASYGKEGYPMAVENLIHVEDVGTIFQLTLMQTTTLPLDLTGCSVVFRFQAPDGLEYERTASIHDVEGGIVRYTAQEGDIHVAGNWKYQAIVTAPGGKWHSQIVKYKVKTNL